eukprot:1194961-Prorocentrum_minimum.AAC.2
MTDQSDAEIAAPAIRVTLILCGVRAHDGDDTGGGALSDVLRKLSTACPLRRVVVQLSGADLRGTGGSLDQAGAKEDRWIRRGSYGR